MYLFTHVFICKYSTMKVSWRKTEQSGLFLIVNTTESELILLSTSMFNVYVTEGKKKFLCLLTLSVILLELEDKESN